jgi:hypothetical protein
MRPASIVAVALVSACLLLAGCGGDCRVVLSSGLIVGCGDEPPGPGDPDFGGAAQVLLTDCEDGRLLWVGIASATPTPGVPGNGNGDGGDEFDAMEELRCAGELGWVGGTVRVANDEPNGFFFDPEGIVSLSSAPASVRTTIAAISTDPQFHAPGGSGGEDVWVVPATLLAIETDREISCPVTAPCVP